MAICFYHTYYPPVHNIQLKEVRNIFQGYRFVKHVNPIQSNVQGWIENEHGNIVAVVKLDGRIVEPNYEEDDKL